VWWIAETVAEGEFVWPCVDGWGEEEETLMQCFIPLLKNVFSSFFLLFLTFFFSFYFSPPRTDSAATAAALALAGVGDEDLLGGLAALGPEGLDLLDGVHALDDLPEDDVLAVEPGGLGGAQEELASVGVGAGVGHGKDSRASVLQLEVLILELHSVDGLAASAVPGSEVSTLAHEVGDDAVEAGALEAEPLLAGAQRAEVLARPRGHVEAELHDDLAELLAAGLDVEEDPLVAGHGRGG